MPQPMHILGLMSGTSLDGLDIAYCRFFDEQPLRFELLAAETIPYPSEWVARLSSLENASALDYALAHVRLGHYFGKCVNHFRQRHPGPVDLISSHGHTIFHQPQSGLTTQIADGDAIAAETGILTAFNFRTFDVALGGQGAPLVPIGDQMLFPNYDACLNLGGIANISFFRNGVRQAFDISPCNMALNHLSRRLGQPFDRDGLLASQGTLDDRILQQMDSLDYYTQPAPKTLGKEWFVSLFQPFLDNGNAQDLLRTSVEHIARQIANVLRQQQVDNLLITGGGAKNRFLIGRLEQLSPRTRVVRPSDEVIDYKESIVFALLGYLRLKGLPNCLASVTGARYDNVGGQLSAFPTA